MKYLVFGWHHVVVVSVAGLILSTVSHAAPATARNASIRNASMFSDTSDGTNWPSYGRTYDEGHYSPLTEINDKTIGHLKLQSFIDLPRMIGSATGPLAVDGTLYFSVGLSFVYAADPMTGKILWTYDPKVADATNDKLRGAWGNRGPAYADGRIFVGTLDGRLIALDAKTGKLLWSTQTTEPGDGRYISGPPRVFNGKVIIGHGGADFAPVRGYVSAYDTATGKQVWRFYLVPGDPAKGFENKAMEMAAKTWKGEWWKFGGGGTAWHAITYDAKYNRVLIGTGNGAPWNQEIRSPGGGDNLFVCSIVALDADTGEYIWHYQTNPGEEWDYNSDMDITLATLKIDGKERDVVMHAPKNGFFYVIDRTNGKLISAEPFVPQTWARYIDKDTGRPVETPEARFPKGQGPLSPSGLGGHNWNAMSYNPSTGLVYLPSTLQATYMSRIGVDAKTWKHAPRMVMSTGYGSFPEMDLELPTDKPVGALQAWDPVAQKARWSIPSAAYIDGGTLTTGGNLVFQGKADGTFNALAADTGKPLWSMDAQNGIRGHAITYTVGGRQYLTVITGFDGLAAMFAGASSKFGWQYETQLRRVLTFTLYGKASLPPFKKPPPPEIIDHESMKIDEAKRLHGRDIFNDHCVVCHGVNAIAAGTAPDLRASPVPLSSESFSDVVHKGALRPAGMPAFDELSASDVESLRHYVRGEARKALKKLQAAPVR